MTRTNKTRSALFTSILSLLLCVSMLVGTTFAWFTDVAQSSGNKIQAGTLQVELWEKDAQGQEHNISESSVAVFNYDLWEPGYSDYADLIIKNVGTLALKYQMTFQNIVFTGDADITKVLDVYVGDTKVGTLNELGTTGVLAEGHLLANTSVALDRIKVVMQTTAGNQYQGCGVTFDVVVHAIQYNEEYDGFGNPDYDINADGTPDHPEFDFSITGVNTTVTVPADSTGNYVYTNGDNTVTVTIPNATASAKYDIVVKPTADNSTTPVAANQGALSFDISVKNAEDNDVPATIVLDVKKNMPNVKVFHNGAEMAASTYTYDATSGKLTIDATNYSIYTVRYEYVAEVKGHTYGTLQEAFDAAQNGDTVNLLTNITTDASKNTEQDRLTVSKDLTLNLGAYTITVPAELEPTKNWMAIQVDGGSLTVNATSGGIYSNDYATPKAGVYAFHVANGGSLTINGGSYDAGVTVANVQKGSLTVNGGTFKVLSTNNGGKYLLNCIDAAYANGTATVSVTGGTFYDFDPANSASENPVANFLADGYKSTENNGAYTVTEADFYTDAEGVWHIRTPEGMQEFKAMAESDTDKFYGETVVLDCDINMYNKYWMPICGDSINSYPSNAFKGTFDGQGHTISNLSVTTVEDVNASAGLFGSISHGAVIKNVILKDSSIRGTHWTGGIVGYISDGNDATVTDCQVINCTITADYIMNEADDDAKEEFGYMVNGDKAGGIIGYCASGIITYNVVKDCNINGYRDLGGIAGFAGAGTTVSGNTVDTVTVTVNSSYNYKNYASLDKHYVGEVVGRNSATLENNTVNGFTVVEAQ